MAASKENTLRWISDEKEVHLIADYGSNLQSVTDATKEQKERSDVVTSYQEHVDALPAEDNEEERASYELLKFISQKRLDCLNDISKIAELETSLGDLSVAISETVTSLVSTGSGNDVPEVTDNGIKTSAQNNILAVRENWKWIAELLKHTEIHLNNSSEYQQFFHEVKENESWMPVELRGAQDKVKLHETSEGTNKEGQRWLLDIKELLTLFLHWEAKTEKLFERSKKVVPVQLRMQTLDYFRPVESLAAYKTNAIGVKQGETLLLIDNSNKQSWLVRNSNAVEGHVPSIICAIPGPDPDAISAAMRLRFQLLSEWTQNVKRVGKSLILFNILTLRDRPDDEIQKMKAIPSDKKEEIARIMDYTESTLSPNWKGYAGFDELQSRIEATKDVLDEDGDEDRDEEFEATLLDPLKTEEDLMKNYQTMWSQWEAYKILVEASRHPDNLLIVDKWEQLKFIPMDELRRLWQQGLTFGDDDNADFDVWLNSLKAKWSPDDLDGQRRTEEEEKEEEERKRKEMEIEATIERTKETATTAQMSHAEHEEEKKFVVTAVIDPRSGYEISMQDAINCGVIDNEKGQYVNPATKYAIPIPQAMSEGKIRGELKSTKKTREKRRDLGLITISTQRESRPYTIQAVIDAKTDTRLTIEEAIKNGTLDQSKSIYHNTLTDQDMSLSDALESGLLVVKYDANTPTAEPDIVNITYAIHWVADKLRRSRANFVDAIATGLLNTETGEYFHNEKGEYLKLTDAIKNGDIKATVVKDPKAMDIDPQNIVVVETLVNLKAKMMNPMTAIAALKKAEGTEEKESKVELSGPPKSPLMTAGAIKMALFSKSAEKK